MATVYQPLGGDTLLSVLYVLERAVLVVHDGKQFVQHSSFHHQLQDLLSGANDRASLSYIFIFLL